MLSLEGNLLAPASRTICLIGDKAKFFKLFISVLVTSS